ncbi:MAG: hypothetical protein QOF89_331 [Acidobacteriota bacterium]|jgi:hypothetical protein|nr:hypothetical protein [Acidobacteriota bacterium]
MVRVRAPEDGALSLVMGNARAVKTATLDSWLRRRSRFHHDWLNNRFRPFLHARRETLEQCELNGEALEDSLAGQLREWEAHLPEAAAFLGAAADALSPAQLLDSEAFSCLAPPLREWMRETVAALYRDRAGLALLVEAAEAALREADRRYLVVAAHVLAPEAPSEMPATALLIEAVKELSRSISVLPHGIETA